MTTSVYFDDLNTTQRLTIFLFAMLSQEPSIPRREVIAEGLFAHLHACLMEEISAFSEGVGAEDCCFMPFIADDEHPDLMISSIFAADDSLAPIVPHESECFPLVVGEGVLVPHLSEDKNPYTITHWEPYGEEHEGKPRRMIILGVLNAEMAAYFGTEPMMVALDFDCSGEDAPNLCEFPLDFGEALTRLLAKGLTR